MGDFAELNVRFKIKKESPVGVIDVLHYMTGLGEEPNQIPDHLLFKSNRWNTMLRSFSDDTNVLGQLTSFEKNHRSNEWSLCIRSIFRDRGEIDLFFDWIHPYINEQWLSFLGYVIRDAADGHPYLIYYKDEGTEFLKVSCEEYEVIGRPEINFRWGINMVQVPSSLRKDGKINEK